MCGGKTVICEILTAFSFWFPSLQGRDRADTTRLAGLNIFYSSTIKYDTTKDMFAALQFVLNKCNAVLKYENSITSSKE